MTPIPLQIEVFPEPTLETWEHGLIYRGVERIRIGLGAYHWYGQGGLGHQQWPLEKIAQYPAPFLTSDNGATGLLGTLHPVWFASNGVGVLVDTGLSYSTSFNAPLSGQAPAHSFSQPAPLRSRPPLSSEVQGDGWLTIEATSGDRLDIRFIVAGDVRGAVDIFLQGLTITPPPPPLYFEKPLWTTWANFKNDISHEKVLDYAHKIRHYGFECGTLGIDAKWQTQFGDTQFDSAKFPNPQQTLDELHALGMKVTLWCVPFYSQQSQHFQPAIDQQYVIRDADGQPYIGDWWEGKAVFLDISAPGALDWHLNNLSQLAESYGLDGFKFDAGEGMFYGNPAIRWFDEQLSPNLMNLEYISGVAARYPWSDVRSGWFSQGESMLFRQWDKSSAWGFDNGLASCIPQAMTFNLLGYPYSFPDMIGGNKYGEQVVTGELLIRWTQAVAPMPIIQFSLAPWDYGEECAALCARYARLHGELAAYAQSIVPPIVRPLWWVAPTDEDALTCADEYLVGDDVLVAPVITEGATERDIYLPPGRWCSYWDESEAHQGGAWLRAYPAPLDVLPLFKRVSE